MMITTNRTTRLIGTLLFATHGLACATKDKQPVAAASNIPAAVSAAKLENGIASVYTDHRTASGERFSARALTAAHRTLPFGTRVRVTSVRTGRSAIVRINDRGPFIRGRIIDLSPAAAAHIGLTKKMGVTRVDIVHLH